MFVIKPRIYIMAPYSKPEGSQEQNVRRSILAAEEISGMGGVPYIPNLTHYWQAQQAHSWKFWIAQDLHWLLVCQAAVRLNFGVSSAGADVEQFVAETHQIPVFQWTWIDNEIRQPERPHQLTDWIDKWREENA